MGGSRGGTGGPDPPEKSQKIGFLSNTGPDLLKNHKATKPAFNVGPLSARQPLTSLSGSAHGCTSKSCIFEKVYISVLSISTPVTLRMQKALSIDFCCTVELSLVSSLVDRHNVRSLASS